MVAHSDWALKSLPPMQTQDPVPNMDKGIGKVFTHFYWTFIWLGMREKCLSVCLSVCLPIHKNA